MNWKIKNEFNANRLIGFDINNLGHDENYEILEVGNSQNPLKIMYFKTNINLHYDDNNIAVIPKILLPRNEYIINNIQ